MIIEKWLDLQSKGFSLDHIYLLDFISKSDKDVSNYTEGNVRADSILIFLKRKGLVSADNRIAQQGMDLINYVQNAEYQKVASADSFKEWVDKVHKNLQDLLFKLTGKKQKVGKINKKSYSFLCNTIDLHTKLLKVRKIYGFSDRVKAEKVLQAYTEKCFKEDEWFPIIEYYIEKEGKSRFFTDYCEYNENQIQEETKPVNTKHLF